MRMKAAIGLTLCLAGLLAGISGARGDGIARSPTAQARSQDPAVLQRAFGIRFSQRSVIRGRPALPDGERGLSLEEAIRVAMLNAPHGVTPSGRLLPGVEVAASFGLFSDDRYGQREPSGGISPYLQSRPAWVVTLWGPGLVDPALGPGPVGRVHHEDNLVIDAATGQFLLCYTYR